MARLLLRCATAGSLACLPLVGSPSVTEATCAPTRALVAYGYGAPDDVAIDGARILFTEEPRGILAVAERGRVRPLARGLRGPEGVLVRNRSHVVLVEQELNRIVELTLPSGARRVLTVIPNRTGKLGIDSIAPAPGSGIYVPDSPHGRLLLLDKHLHLHVLARGLGRPVGAVRFRGMVAVADETRNAVWGIRGRRITRLATVPTPDDVAVLGDTLIAVTLGDGSLWEIRPTKRLLLSGFREPQGLGVARDGSVIVADSKANAIYRVTGLGPCLNGPAAA